MIAKPRLFSTLFLGCMPIWCFAIVGIGIQLAADDTFWILSVAFGCISGWLLRRQSPVAAKFAIIYSMIWLAFGLLLPVIGRYLMP